MRWAVAASVVGLVACAGRDSAGRRLMGDSMATACIDFEGATYEMDAKERPVVTSVSFGSGISGYPVEGMVYISSDNACDKGIENDRACLFDAECGIMGLPDCAGGDSDLSSPDQETILVNCARRYMNMNAGGDCGKQRRPKERTCDTLEEADLTRDLTGECNTLLFDFADFGPVDISKLSVIDVDEPAYIQAFGEDGMLVAPTMAIAGADGMKIMEPVDYTGVLSLKIHFVLSGGVAEICFDFPVDDMPVSYSFGDQSFSYSYSYDAFTDAFDSYSYSYSLDSFTDTFDRRRA